MNAHLVDIDDQLPQLLKQLESRLAIRFDAQIIGRILVDADDYSISHKVKQYILYKSSTHWLPWTITGIVDDYEPETIWLESHNGGLKQQEFDAFFKAQSID